MASVLFFVRGMLQFQLMSVYYRWKMPVKPEPEPEPQVLKPAVVRRQLRPPTLNMTLVAPIMETPNLSPQNMKNETRESDT